MSEEALNTIFLGGLGSNERLSALYIFSGLSATGLYYQQGGSDEPYFTGRLPNSSYANQPNLHSGSLLAATGDLFSTALTNASDIFLEDRLNLTESNFQVPLDGLDPSNISYLIDFEFQDGDIDDGVILGCFETGVNVISSNEVRTSQGYNIGVTDRGHLFCQTYGILGDSIRVVSSIELSKRNVIGVSVGENFINVSYFDYLNNLIKDVDIPVYKNFITKNANELVTFGGSDTYFRSTDNETKTFSGSLHGLAIFSGFMGESFLKELGEGLIGDYFYNPTVETLAEKVTGYSQTIVYKTGITGYDYNSTGTLEIITGREEFTGRAVLTSSESKREGERFYKYYTLDNDGVKTFYKEELGKLHSNSGYIYYPTGEDAYDTLGLNNVSESILTYTEVTGMTQDKITIDLYGKTPLTGVLSEVSGTIETALTESYVASVEPESSGAILTTSSDGFKKNYIYHMGGRL